jgi:hypothetical protein
MRTIILIEDSGIPIHELHLPFTIDPILIVEIRDIRPGPNFLKAIEISKLVHDLQDDINFSTSILTYPKPQSYRGSLPNPHVRNNFQYFNKKP